GNVFRFGDGWPARPRAVCRPYRSNGGLVLAAYAAERDRANRHRRDWPVCTSDGRPFLRGTHVGARRLTVLRAVAVLADRAAVRAEVDAFDASRSAGFRSRHPRGHCCFSGTASEQRALATFRR